MVLQKLAGNMGIGLHVGQYSYVRFFGVLVRVCTILDFSITHVIWRVVCVTNVQIVTCTFYLTYFIKIIIISLISLCSLFCFEKYCICSFSCITCRNYVYRCMCSIEFLFLFFCVFFNCFFIVFLSFFLKVQK